MKKLLICLTLTIAAMTISYNAATAQTSDKTLRHVVMFKFKDTSSAADVQKIIEAFEALPSKISQIKAFEWGTNNSPEGVNQGLTHCFLLTFTSEKDRDDYIVHPDHKVFGGIVGPHLDKVTVLDYWVK